MRDSTRFGSSTASEQSAAGVLRAVALRLGVSLTPAPPEDLAAAVIAADAWFLVTGADSFDDAAGRGKGALAAITAAVCRASGEPLDPPAVPTRVPPAIDVWHAEIEQYRAWLRYWGLQDAVLTRSGGDLLHAGEGEALSALGELLLYAADPA